MLKMNKFTFDELVFANRNHDYGAYTLRLEQDKYQTKGMLWAFGSLAAIPLLVLLTSSFGPEEFVEEKPKDTVVILEDKKVESIKPAQPKPLPAAPKNTAPKVQFIAVKVVTDTLANDTKIATQEELKKAVISSTTNKGTDTTSTLVMNDRPSGNGDKPTVSVPVEPKPTSTPDGPATYVSEMPSFPGGTTALLSFLSNNLRYPALAREGDITGKVVAKFVVNKDGKVDRISIIRGLGGGCDEETIRVLKLLPKWHPGKHRGVPTDVYYTLPVTFALR
jgi:periplasmic protein TonB